MSLTPAALPAPAFQTLRVKPIWSPALTGAAWSAVLVILIDANAATPVGNAAAAMSATSVSAAANDLVRERCDFKTVTPK